MFQASAGEAPNTGAVEPAVTTCNSPSPRGETSSLPWASPLQGVDDTSSSEGSTVDCPDPEEILRKIPELADDLEEPDDCFTEGKGTATGSLTRMLIRARIQLSKHSPGRLRVQGPGLVSTEDKHAVPTCCLTPRPEGASIRHTCPSWQEPGHGICISSTIRHHVEMWAFLVTLKNPSLSSKPALLS